MKDRGQARCTSHLSCPVCTGSLAELDGCARCAAGHSFDYARSGYLNLTAPAPGRPRIGDSAAMVRARAELLAAGYYAPLADAVADAGAAAAPAGAVVAEIGCGTAYYLAAVVERLRGEGRGPRCSFGFDLSKPAAARSARRHPGMTFAVADVEARIPLRDSVADVVLSAFAPRPAPELARVVRPGGELVAAFAGPGHLEALRERLDLISVREQKLEQLTERLAPWFDPISAVPVEYTVELGEDDARRIVLMGPNARHEHGLERLDGGLSELVSAVVARFGRRRP